MILGRTFKSSKPFRQATVRRSEIVAPNALTEESLCRFLKEHANNRVKRELLLFWGMHPNARFNRFAIGYAVGSSKLDMKIALRDMAEAGLLDTHICNGETLYSFTKNEEKRRSVLELASLGWDRWQLMFKRAEQKAK
jgi:hypothetical protein